jgi:hypothetical protein
MTDQPVPDRSDTPTPPPNSDGDDAKFATGTTAEAAGTDAGSDIGSTGDAGGQGERSGDAPRPSPDI